LEEDVGYAGASPTPLKLTVKHSGGFGKPKSVICKSLLRYRLQERLSKNPETMILELASV